MIALPSGDDKSSLRGLATNSIREPRRTVLTCAIWSHFDPERSVEWSQIVETDDEANPSQ